MIFHAKCSELFQICYHIILRASLKDKKGKRQVQLRASDSAPNPLIPGCLTELSSFLFEIPETTNGKRIGI